MPNKKKVKKKAIALEKGIQGHVEVRRPIDDYLGGKKENEKSSRDRQRERDEALQSQPLTATDGMLFGILGYNPKEMGKNFNKMKSVFAKEVKDEVNMRKIKAHFPIVDRRGAVSVQKQDERRKEDNAVVPELRAWVVKHLPHPLRPKWDKEMTSEQLDESEKRSFYQWMGNIYSMCDPSKGGPSQMAHFEHNLEVWRQLWRVIEKSHVVIIVADARNPLLHISEPLVKLVQAEGKRLVLLLNKVDLLPPEKLAEWLDYLPRRFPGVDTVVQP